MKTTDKNGEKSEQTTCRKFVLRVLKRILESAKNTDQHFPSENRLMVKLQSALDEIRKTCPRFGAHFQVRTFGTFHLRTLMWYLFYEVYNEPHFWLSTSKQDRLHMTLIKLRQWLSGEIDVPHFFLPEIQMLQSVSKKERQYLYLVAEVTIKLFCSQK